MRRTRPLMMGCEDVVPTLQRLKKPPYLSLLNLSECKIAGIFCLRFHKCMLSSVKTLTSAPCRKGSETCMIWEYTEADCMSLSANCTVEGQRYSLIILLSNTDFHVKYLNNIWVQTKSECFSIMNTDQNFILKCKQKVTLCSGLEQNLADCDPSPYTLWRKPHTCIPLNWDCTF